MSVKNFIICALVLVGLVAALIASLSYLISVTPRTP